MDILDWISEHWGISHDILRKILFSLAAILVLTLLRQMLLKLIFLRVKKVRSRYNWKSSIRYVYIILVFIAIGTIWVDEFHSFATFLGLISAGLAVALKDPIANLAGWLFILFRRPFEVGDRVQIGNYAGDVIDIRAFQFTLNEIGNWVDSDQSTGRIVHIPNSKVFIEGQFNYQQGFNNIWNEIQVRITFESDWKKAKEILLDVVGRHTTPMSKTAENYLMEASKKYLIFYSSFKPVVYTKVKKYGVSLTMRYMCIPKKRRITEHAIWEDILHEFSRQSDINFAYPTQRIYFDKQHERKNAGSHKAIGDAAEASAPKL